MNLSDVASTNSKLLCIHLHNDIPAWCDKHRYSHTYAIRSQAKFLMLQILSQFCCSVFPPFDAKTVTLGDWNQTVQKAVLQLAKLLENELQLSSDSEAEIIIICPCSALGVIPIRQKWSSTRNPLNHQQLQPPISNTDIANTKSVSAEPSTSLNLQIIIAKSKLRGCVTKAERARQLCATFVLVKAFQPKFQSDSDWRRSSSLQIHKPVPARMAVRIISRPLGPSDR